MVCVDLKKLQMLFIWCFKIFNQRIDKKRHDQILIKKGQSSVKVLRAKTFQTGSKHQKAGKNEYPRLPERALSQNTGGQEGGEGGFIGWAGQMHGQRTGLICPCFELKWHKRIVILFSKITNIGATHNFSRRRGKAPSTRWYIYKVPQLPKPHCHRLMGHAWSNWNLRQMLNQKVKSVSDLCNCFMKLQGNDEEKSRPKTAPGKYTFGKEEKEEQTGRNQEGNSWGSMELG